MTLPHTGSELKVALWVSSTPEQFILYVRSVIHACKEMDHDVKFLNAEEAVATEKLDLEIKKEEYAQVHKSERKKNKGNPGEHVPATSESLVAAKSAYEKAKQAVDAKLTAAKEGVKAFELYGILLSDEARQPWEMIIQDQMTKCPQEDVYGVTHDKTPTITWDTFMECVTIHVQQGLRQMRAKPLDITYPTR